MARNGSGRTALGGARVGATLGWCLGFGKECWSARVWRRMMLGFGWLRNG